MYIQNYINICVSYARIKNDKREIWKLVNLFYLKDLKLVCSRYLVFQDELSVDINYKYVLGKTAHFSKKNVNNI